VDPSEKIVPVSKETDIVMARIAGAELADRLGFGTIDKHRHRQGGNPGRR
jgi:hypothetical protein